MSGRRRRFAVAGVVVATLVGVLLHGALVGDGAGVEGNEQPGAAVVADWSPVGVVPATLRARTLVDGELVSAVPFLQRGLIGLAGTVVSGLAASVAAWWCRSRSDRRLGVPLRCSSLAALRAPPAYV